MISLVSFLLIAGPAVVFGNSVPSLALTASSITTDLVLENKYDFSHGWSYSQKEWFDYLDSFYDILTLTDKHPTANLSAYDWDQFDLETDGIWALVHQLDPVLNPLPAEIRYGSTNQNFRFLEIHYRIHGLAYVTISQQSRFFGMLVNECAESLCDPGFQIAIISLSNEDDIIGTHSFTLLFVTISDGDFILIDKILGYSTAATQSSTSGTSWTNDFTDASTAEIIPSSTVDDVESTIAISTTSIPKLSTDLETTMTTLETESSSTDGSTYFSPSTEILTTMISTSVTEICTCYDDPCNPLEQLGYIGEPSLWTLENPALLSYVFHSKELISARDWSYFPGANETFGGLDATGVWFTDQMSEYNYPLVGSPGSYFQLQALMGTIEKIEVQYFAYGDVNLATTYQIGSDPWTSLREQDIDKNTLSWSLLSLEFPKVNAIQLYLPVKASESFILIDKVIGYVDCNKLNSEDGAAGARRTTCVCITPTTSTVKTSNEEQSSTFPVSTTPPSSSSTETIASPTAETVPESTLTTEGTSSITFSTTGSFSSSSSIASTLNASVSTESTSTPSFITLTTVNPSSPNSNNTTTMSSPLPETSTNNVPRIFPMNKYLILYVFSGWFFVFK